MKLQRSKEKKIISKIFCGIYCSFYLVSGSGELVEVAQKGGV